MSEHPRRYEKGDHVQVIGAPKRFGVVVEGLQEACANEPRSDERRDGLTADAARIKYGYVIRVRWGADAFTSEPMWCHNDGAKFIHIKHVEPACQEASALLAKMLDVTGWPDAGSTLGGPLTIGTYRLDMLKQAAKSSLRPRGYFPSQTDHKVMEDCETLGWLRRVMVGRVVTFEITSVGRDVEAALHGAARDHDN